MPELTFVPESKLEVSDPQGIDFNASGKIYILLGDIAPKDIFDQFTYFLWDVKQRVYDFVNGWKDDLKDLYQKAEVKIDYDTTYKEFLNAVNAADTIGVVFIGHGGEGALSFTDLSLLPTATSVHETNLQFLFLFACQAKVTVEGKTWKTETSPNMFYAPEEKVRIEPALPFVDTLANEGDQLIDELKHLKRRILK